MNVRYLNVWHNRGATRWSCFWGLVWRCCSFGVETREIRALSRPPRYDPATTLKLDVRRAMVFYNDGLVAAMWTSDVIPLLYIVPRRRMITLRHEEHKCWNCVYLQRYTGSAAACVASAPTCSARVSGTFCTCPAGFFALAIFFL